MIIMSVYVHVYTRRLDIIIIIDIFCFALSIWV